ncbi:MAG: hypothetical protein V1775_10105 [Bacteroidota bacterium]
MKTGRLLLLIVSLLLAGSVSASIVQGEPHKIVSGDQSVAIGGYLSLGIGNTIIDKNNALLVQFRMAARVGHSLSLGIAGSGFSDRLYGLNHDRPGISPDGYCIEGGYGGLLLEPVFAPDFPVHLSFPVLIGVGGMAFTEYGEDDNRVDGEYDSDRVVLERAAYLVVEPGVELEFNLFRYLRMGAGLSHRFTTGITVEGQKEHLLNGLSGSVSLKFGIF